MSKEYEAINQRLDNIEEILKLLLIKDTISDMNNAIIQKTVPEQESTASDNQKNDTVNEEIAEKLELLKYFEEIYESKIGQTVHISPTVRVYYDENLNDVAISGRSNLLKRYWKILEYSSGMYKLITHYKKAADLTIWLEVNNVVPEED